MSMLVTLSAETSAHGSDGVNAYVVGAGSLGLLLLLLAIVLAFGGGREHT